MAHIAYKCQFLSKEFVTLPGKIPPSRFANGCVVVTIRRLPYVVDHGNQFVFDRNSLTRSEGRQVHLAMQLDQFADFASHCLKLFQLDTEHCWWTLHQRPGE